MAEALPEIKPPKAYKNMDFINSREARTIRVICEFEETLQRMRQESVKETIVFFGSSHALPRDKFDAQLAAAKKRAADKKLGAEERKKAEEEVEVLGKREWMCEMYAQISELSRRLTEWSLSYRSRPVVGGGYLATDKGDGLHDDPPAEAEQAEQAARAPKRRGSALDRSTNAWAQESETDGEEGRPKKRAKKEKSGKQSLLVCTGGGRGLMEAANRGAAQVAGAKSIGMGISMPGNPGLNPYVTPELAFEFHYFFTRKYWMLYPCRALVCPPGGFATMDCLFELLTLKQTGKIKIDIPVVMFGVQYWNELVDFKALVRFGTISQRDHDSLFFTDSVDDAFEFVTKKVLELRDKDPEIFFNHHQ